MEGEEVDAVSRLDGLERQAERQMGFPHSRRAQKKDILPLMKEAPGSQFVDLGFGQRRLGLLVEILERLTRDHAGQP